MLILRQLKLADFLKLHVRQYAKKARTMAVSPKKMVHKETLRYVNPYARINVQSDIYLRVIPADVHEYTSGDVFIAQLCGEAVKNCPAELKVSVSDDDKEVNVTVKKLSDEANFVCDLKIPIKSELQINANNNVHVQGVHGEKLDVKALKNIQAAEIRATSISLSSEHGNINCTGTLLGKTTEICTNSGHIILGKLQGDHLRCKSISGGISTECCYVEKSEFQSETGCLKLKNVHKQCQVLLNKGGELHMSGVHGNLNVVAKNGRMNLQLSDLFGSNSINVDDMEQAVINITEDIEQNAYVLVTANEILLETSFANFNNALSEDKKRFEISRPDERETKLLIYSTGQKNIRIGKLSWTEMLRNSMNIE